MSSHLSYDDVAYRTTPVTECDPHAMATVANLFGLEAADPSDCDVLDVGCGDGLNLLSLANAYPGIRGVGFDPAAVAIERGDLDRKAAGLDNVKLVSEITDGELDGNFDYVMAHGVLSWIDDESRAKVIEQSAKAARPGGLVNFSYRTYPYVHYELPAREMAKTAAAHARARAEAAGEPFTWQDEVAAARARVGLAAAVAGKTLHGQIMTSMAQKWAASADWFVWHDDLSEPLQPFRMSEVVELAAAHGLKYVGELVPQEFWQLRLDPALADQVRELGGPDAAARQQVCDDLIGNGFHSSLFVKADDTPNLEPSTEGLTLYARQYVMNTENGPVRADAVSAPVAQVIREREPGITSAADIAEDLGRDLEYVEHALLQLHTRELARVTTAPVSTPAPAGDRPKLSPFPAVQLAQPWDVISSRFHLPVRYDDYDRRQLLLLCDGTRDRAALARDFAAMADESNQAAYAQIIEHLDFVLDEAALLGLLGEPNDA